MEEKILTHTEKNYTIDFILYTSAFQKRTEKKKERKDIIK